MVRVVLAGSEPNLRDGVKKVVFIRHGESLANVLRKKYESHPDYNEEMFREFSNLPLGDVSVTDKGLSQAAALGERLRTEFNVPQYKGANSNNGQDVKNNNKLDVPNMMVNTSKNKVGNNKKHGLRPSLFGSNDFDGSMMDTSIASDDSTVQQGPSQQDGPGSQQDPPSYEVWVSPMRRTVETAQTLFGGLLAGRPQKTVRRTTSCLPDQMGRSNTDMSSTSTINYSSTTTASNRGKEAGREAQLSTSSAMSSSVSTASSDAEEVEYRQDTVNTCGTLSTCASLSQLQEQHQPTEIVRFHRIVPAAREYFPQDFAKGGNCDEVSKYLGYKWYSDEWERNYDSVHHIEDPDRMDHLHAEFLKSDAETIFLVCHWGTILNYVQRFCENLDRTEPLTTYEKFLCNGWRKMTHVDPKHTDLENCAVRVVEFRTD